MSLPHACFALFLLFAGAEFFSGTDLPLMPGFEELAESGVVFDKPSGRIVQVVAFGSEAPSAVRAFYAEALAELGWAEAGTAAAHGLKMRREGETLSLDLSHSDGQTVVSIVIQPAAEQN